MSAALSINGKNLVPIKEVLGSTDYTRDYIAKLAREGQIVAAQVGRQWYVDAASLENFKATSALEAEVRRRHLSYARRRERDLKQEAEKHFDIVAVKHRRAVAHAVVQSALVLVVGFSTGYFIYALSYLNPGVVLVQKAQTFLLAEKLPTGYSVAGGAAVGPIASTTVTEQISFTAVHEVAAFGSTTGVLLLPNIATTGALVVEDLFSDPVQVVSSSHTNGELIIGSDSAATRTVPFVIVPVEAVVSEVAVAQPEDNSITP